MNLILTNLSNFHQNDVHKHHSTSLFQNVLSQGQANSFFNAVIPFNIEHLNEGGAMDLAAGVFTVPVDGIYHFEFSYFFCFTFHRTGLISS